MPAVNLATQYKADALQAPGLEQIRNGAISLVDGPVIPIRSSDSRSGEQPDPIPLAAVGEKLEIGDELGVVLFGTHDQYENEAHSHWITSTVEVSGLVEIPISSPAIITRQ